MKQVLITLLFLCSFLFGLSQNQITYKTEETLLSDVYYSNGSYYVVLDFIIIKENGTFTNSNPKLRTFEIDPQSEIYTSDCTIIDVSTLFLNKKLFINQVFICFLTNETINTLNSFYCVN
jgi:hypothetical protein